MKQLTFSTLSLRWSSTRVLRLCTTTALLTLASAVAQASLPGSTVGEVSFVIGKAWIEKPGAGRELVTVGTRIGVFDKIDTTSNGHVQIRFIDDGLFSLRPQSTLEIQRYDYNPANPEASAVKLNLIEGEARSISGEAAHKAPHNYRMNTPIAAIGVRGTDFVAVAERKEVEARINEGAIVVAPFSSQCLADALGPCDMSGLELAYGSSQVLQVSADAGDPVLLAISSSGLPESIIGQSLVRPPVAQVASERDERKSSELYAESVSTLAVTETIARPVTSNPGSGEPGGPAVPSSPPPPPPPVTVAEYTPDIPVDVATLKNNQLLWGRYGNGAGQAHDRITVDNKTLKEGRNAAVGNGTSYALYRIGEKTALVKPGLGIVGFALNSAQATYTTNGTVELLDVSGGTLSIDFKDATFSTSLDLRSSVLGAINFNANGRIGDAGYFSMVGIDQEMAGAVSLDGVEAGYYFEKVLESGALEGLTLWGRQP
jgi:hypothetical protein